MTYDDERTRALASRENEHPRPQLVRADWSTLVGPWRFLHDDADLGLQERWWAEWPAGDREIVVPFAPESEASGIGDTGFHRVLWYHRTFEIAEDRVPDGNRMMLHFGAVDYRCTVWIDGHRVGSHEGGQTPFSFDITDVLGPDRTHTVVVRSEDDPHDASQLRGKQDWLAEPHVVWYHRTSGIWQAVWLEVVPRLAVDSLHWATDPARAEVTLDLRLSATPLEPVTVRISLSHAGVALAEVSVRTESIETTVRLALPSLMNGQAYEELLWTPENPRLVEAEIEVGSDRVWSYLGMRSARVEAGRFLLNDRPYFVRSVLSQGYWPTSHLTAPSEDALKAEVQLTKDLGFNAARIHQKFEDPRFLYWTDRLGLLVWAEAPAAYSYTPLAVERTMREWLEIVHRDYSHPSIVTWVPLNESWGVQHISQDPRMRAFARSLADLTRAIDSTRPVISNDGWEHVNSDILTIHDYEWDPEIMAARYGDRAELDALIAGWGPAGRRILLGDDMADAPIMLTEFGGISYDVARVHNAWGYSSADSSEAFEKSITGLIGAVAASRHLAGYCYTQLTDTMQETNGLLDENRVPKLPIAVLRAIIAGTD